MLFVPLTTDPAQTFTITLDGVSYSFYVKYNERSASWTFDLGLDATQTTLLTGVPMLTGQDMLYPYGLGIGCLTMSDESHHGVDAGPDDLGERVTMTYLTPDELANLNAQARIIRAGGTP